MPHHDTNGWMFWGQGVGMMFWWIVAVVIIALIVVFIAKTSRREGKSESPLETAKKRFAKGEISKEEFENLKKDLS